MKRRGVVGTAIGEGQHMIECCGTARREPAGTLRDQRARAETETIGIDRQSLGTGDRID
jgi:hypothetical protein